MPEIDRVGDLSATFVLQPDEPLPHDPPLNICGVQGSLEPGDRVIVGGEDVRLTFEVVEGAAALTAE
jgi:hypothetical protein